MNRPSDPGKPTFDQVWCVDTEYRAIPGERVKPICLVAREIHAPESHRRWLWDCDPGAPPWDPDDPRALIVSYSAPAECSVFAVLGWRQPVSLVDLWAEYRARTNGLTMKTKFLDALEAYGVSAQIDGDEKKQMQMLCANGTAKQIRVNRSGIVNYCEGDVLLLCKLYACMAPSLDWGAALLRGEYGVACAEIEHRGIPIDAERLAVLVDRWDEVRAAAASIATTRMRFRIYGGPNEWDTIFV